MVSRHYDADTVTLLQGCGDFGDKDQIANSLREAAQGSHNVMMPPNSTVRSGKVDDGELDKILLETLMADESEEEEEPEEEELPEPGYSVERDGEQAVLTVELAGVTSLADVDLEVDDECVELEVEGRYKLYANLSRWLDGEIDEDSVTAGFDKTTGTLTIRASVL